MYGFLQTRIVDRERGQGYPFQIGYLKGTGPIFSGIMEEVPGGSAGNDSCYINFYIHSLMFDLISTCLER